MSAAVLVYFAIVEREFLELKFFYF